jgi:hypothetical protein
MFSVQLLPLGVFKNNKQESVDRRRNGVARAALSNAPEAKLIPGQSEAA